MTTKTTPRAYDTGQDENDGGALSLSTVDFTTGRPSRQLSNLLEWADVEEQAHRELAEQNTKHSLFHLAEAQRARRRRGQLERLAFGGGDDAR